jgi:beta-xylosidase
VLQQGRTDINGPHQGALVDTPDHRWWFLHFQDAGIYMRIVHLQPVRWEDGWPIAGIGGEPVRRHSKPVITPSCKIAIPQATDEFTASELGLQWQWQANHRDDW